MTSRRRQLGNELRHARAAVPMTQQAAARILDCGQSKINKIESGAVAAKIGDLRMLLDAYDVSQAQRDTLLNLARSGANGRGQWSGYRSVVPHWFRTFTDLEPAASEILSWHGERIPGPLQSEHYMLKQFTEARTTDVTAQVRNRAERKRIFDNEQPPYYRFILGEAALRRVPGGANPAISLDQAQALLRLIRAYERTFIHVLPFEAKLPYVPNDFTVMRFSGATKDFVFAEHVAGGVYIEDENDFDLFVDAWDRLRGAALEQDESVDFLEKIVTEYRGKLTF